MPPEPLPWDRKDFFKERKHERSESLGSAPRWRESSASHHGGSRGFTRWGSADFRRPPGHGKQGGWHLFPEENGHGYMPSRSADKLLEDDGGRRSVFRGDGKYNRSYRENRGSFAQRDWKSSHSWETSNGSPHISGRPNDMNSNNPRSVDVVTFTSPTHSDSGNAWESRQLHSKDQQEKVNGVNGLNTGQRCDGENPTGSLEWKPLKWSRSGSLSSRGSGLSHSSSSKSMGGVDSKEAKVGLVSVNVNSVQSPSGDAAVCTTPAAPCEETKSRKKPRLGWGEGLAKYEKKRVDGPEDVVARNDAEVFHSLGVNVADKSPRLTGFSDCASPATPSSVACSSSPGVEEKSFVKSINVDNEVNNLCESPGPVSQNQQEGAIFNLEKLDMSSIDTLGYSLALFLQSDDSSSVDSSFVRSTAINKLLLLKDDALKELEVTEIEVDKLETELKSLTSVSRNSCPCTASSNSLSIEGKAPKREDQCNVSNMITRPAPLQIVSSCNVDEGEVPICNGEMEERHANIKDEDVDSPGTVTSKFVEPISHVKDPVSSSQSKRSEDLNATKLAENVTDQSVLNSPSARTGLTAYLDDSLVVEGMTGRSVNDGSEQCSEDMLCQSILTANKEAANRASEALLRLLPRNEAKFVNERVAEACDQTDSSIQEKFAKRKRLLKFKERAITLKFKAFHHLWKEDMRLLSLRKSRVKSQKKFESCLRITLNGYQKHRSSIRSRVSSPVGNVSRNPTKEIVGYARQLLSDPQTMRCRSNLKMPALILDERDKTASRFISNNGLVEDPCAVEKERAVVNPWTPEEREVFLDKLAAFGKDFTKIASFLDHKTTADCVEFYYKNHKSDCFKRIKKKPVSGKHGKPISSNTYLVTSGKRWNREMNTVSLDVLGDASLLAAQSEGKILEPHVYSGMFSSGGCGNSRMSGASCRPLERASSFDMLGSDREAAAADVLAGICGSVSSEAMGSCITSSLDPGELKYQRACAVKKWPLTPDVMEHLEDETCSSESCGDMEPSDWTDEERAALINAVSTYGKDFSMISRCVRTRSVDQCKVFFSKARKCLGLDLVPPQTGSTCPAAEDDNDGVDSDVDDACALETGSVVCSEKASSKTEEDLPSSLTRVEDDVSDPVQTLDLQSEVNHSKQDEMDVEKEVKCVEESICRTSKDEPGLVVRCVDTASALVGPEKTATPIPVAKVGTTGTGASPSELTSVRGAAHPLASSSQSSVEEPSLLKTSETNVKDESGVKCSVQDPDAVVDSSSSPVVAMSARAGFNLNSDSKYEVLGSVETPSFGPSLQDKDEAATRCERSNTLSRVSSGGLDLSVSSDKLSCLGLGHSLNRGESSQILRGYPIQVPAKDMNGDSSDCRELSGSQSLPKPDCSVPARYMQPPPDCFLRKCNTVDPSTSTSGLPLGKQKSDQTNIPPSIHVQSTTEVDKPSGTSDFKLFGKILSTPSSHQKPNANILESAEKGPLQPKFTVAPLNTGPPSSLNGDGSSTLLKYDRNGYMGFGNIPLRGYGFWDGNRRIQTGFSAMPESSAVLLAKYPAAFSNCALPTSAPKVEPQPLHAAANKNSDCSLKGTSPLFSAMELPNGNGVVDYPVFNAGKVQQPFALEMKQRQDPYPELPRCNGFEAISGLQQPGGMGMIAMNVVGRGGGVLVGGGACSGVVSDPVAAIKMHYAQSEQLGGGGGSTGGSGSIKREDESWRGGNGDLGR